MDIDHTAKSILITAIVSGCCILLSIVRPSKNKINAFAAGISAISVPGLWLAAFNTEGGNYRDMALLFSVFYFAYCFIVSLVTSFVFQLLAMRKHNNDNG